MANGVDCLLLLVMNIVSLSPIFFLLAIRLVRMTLLSYKTAWIESVYL
ncbi:hypothetical protein HanRHA438_Chr10g0460751 [Helianthus annuus]|uniref:Uncharacterized protein n=1 Tax=Helianthus annuus TaxID=4232 RepID=A0A9K3N4G3_HELAN|nr:hypothetical protein HanXRQr2_Chr10g0448211 [Helianthus annuus]KAJ0514337.1 hypothetical protein HanHA300_Chr10g0368481 [Helianthus annuus]KAJ0880223.1 hypothetical protein HanRHA438_Chr10g0460751 [Helianthus annuus]